MRRHGPNTHFSENCTELLVSGHTFLDKAFGSVRYPKSINILLAIKQNSLTAGTGITLVGDIINSTHLQIVLQSNGVTQSAITTKIVGYT